MERIWQVNRLSLDGTTKGGNLTASRSPFVKKYKPDVGVNTWRMSGKRQGLRSEVLTAEHTNRRLCIPELTPCSLTGSASGEPVTSTSNVKKTFKAKSFLRSAVKFLPIHTSAYPRRQGSYWKHMVIMHIDGKYFSPTLYTQWYVWKYCNNIH
jgi:hypothetical protein